MRSADGSHFRLPTNQSPIWIVLSTLIQKRLPMKRLIVCCDGTWNQRNVGYPTNVQKICEAIKQQANDDIPQSVMYDEGIGTAGLLDKILAAHSAGELIAIFKRSIDF